MIKIKNLITKSELVSRYPVSLKIIKNVIASRNRIKKILKGEDRRLLVIIGPCSVHDLDATIDYAYKLKKLRDKYQDRLEIVMRTYFEKPRTVTGWRGLIYDPDINGTFRINQGLMLARRLLIQLCELGVPAATEFLDIIIMRFITDLISWGAIGARTVESQIHREMASSLSCPIGFKNSTDGNIRIAIDAIRVARNSHIFPLSDDNGKISIYQTKGNFFGHIIMRGGKNPNYYVENISEVCKMLIKYNLPKNIVIDFSHGNCQKQYHRQLDVCDHVCQQIRNGSTAIIGVMVESFLKGGSQNIIDNKSVVYGQSITDPCLGWQDSELLVEKLVAAVDIRF